MDFFFPLKKFLVWVITTGLSVESFKLIFEFINSWIEILSAKLRECILPYLMIIDEATECPFGTF